MLKPACIHPHQRLLRRHHPAHRYDLCSQRAGELVLAEGELLTADTRVDDNWCEPTRMPDFCSV